MCESCKLRNSCKDVYKLRQIFCLVSCKEDSSVIDKDSYRDELPFLWSLANTI